MKYSVPYSPGLYDFIKSLPESKRFSISDMYFSDGKYKSNRKISFADSNWAELKRIKNEFGIEIHYVINPAVYTSDVYMKDGDKELIDILWEAYNDGATMLTFNNIFLLRMESFRNQLPPLRIKASVNNKIKTLEDVQFWYNHVNIKEYILDRSLNRNFDELLRIYEWTSKQGDVVLSLLANEGCLPSCPMKQHCDNLISTYPDFQPNEVNYLTTLHSHTLCTKHYSQNPADVLKSPWLSPVTINQYDPYIDTVKIVGRMVPIELMSKIIRTYLFNTSSMELFDYFSTAAPSVYKSINFSMLEEKGFSQKVKNCKNTCATCNFCDKVLKKIVREEL